VGVVFQSATNSNLRCSGQGTRTLVSRRPDFAPLSLRPTLGSAGRGAARSTGESGESGWSVGGRWVDEAFRVLTAEAITSSER